MGSIMIKNEKERERVISISILILIASPRWCWMKHLNSHHHWNTKFCGCFFSLLFFLAWGCLRERQNWIFRFHFYLFFFFSFFVENRFISFRMSYTICNKIPRTIDPLDFSEETKQKRQQQQQHLHHNRTHQRHLNGDRFSCNTGSGAI